MSEKLEQLPRAQWRRKPPAPVPTEKMGVIIKFRPKPSDDAFADGLRMRSLWLDKLDDMRQAIDEEARATETDDPWDDPLTDEDA